MKGWRLSRFDSQERTFDGEGARLFPGRWNPAGVAVVYASEHLSLAVLEVLIHVRVDQVRVVFHELEITIPDALVEVVRDEQLPRGWDSAAIGPGHARVRRSLGARATVSGAVGALRHRAAGAERRAEPAPPRLRAAQDRAVSAVQIR
jgi:RES domain-containing protein